MLLLINQLAQSAPDPSAKERLLLKLTRRLGLDMRLSAQLHLQASSVRQQMRVYQARAARSTGSPKKPPPPGTPDLRRSRAIPSQIVCNSTIPGSWKEADA